MKDDVCLFTCSSVRHRRLIVGTVLIVPFGQAYRKDSSFSTLLGLHLTHPKWSCPDCSPCNRSTIWHSRTAHRSEWCDRWTVWYMFVRDRAKRDQRSTREYQWRKKSDVHERLKRCERWDWLVSCDLPVEESRTIDRRLRRPTFGVFQCRKNSQTFVGDEGVRIEELNEILRVDHGEQTFQEMLKQRIEIHSFVSNAKLTVFVDRSAVRNRRERSAGFSLSCSCEIERR